MMFAPGHRITVVLADDHEVILAKVKEILTGRFHVVATARDGIKAIQAVMEFAPDVLILDILMPGLDGIRVAREIRNLGLATRLIFLTIEENVDYVRTAREMGASYVVKTRMLADLPVAVSEAIDGRTFVSQFPDAISAISCHYR